MRAVRGAAVAVATPQDVGGVLQAPKVARQSNMCQPVRHEQGRMRGMAMVLSGFIVFTLVLAGFVPSTIAAAPPCALLPLADVQRVLGGGFEPFLATPTMCAYTRHKGGDQVMLGLGGSLGSSAQTLNQSADAYRSRGIQVTSAAGLGPGAFSVVPPGSPAATLMFGKGNLVATLQVSVNNKPDLSAALKLAKVVYTKM
jgi:hypothetical protein